MKLTKELYTPSEVAKIFNVSVDTIRYWIKHGYFGDGVITTPGGHHRIKKSSILALLQERNQPIKKYTVIYARESSSHQKDSLNNQVDMLIDWCNKNGMSVDKVITDIASAMNFNRKGLWELIELSQNGLLDTVVISYKDRLARFGYDLIHTLLSKWGTKIIVVNDIESPPNRLQEIIDDFISIIHYFSMRIYGSRSYKKTKELKNKILSDVGVGNEET